MKNSKEYYDRNINPLSANSTKWSNTLNQFVGFLSEFGHFVGWCLKG